MGESKNQNFNHLKIHSQYSICEGAIKIDDLKDFSKENKIKSLALSDTTNLCGALEFAEKISKVGTQPIIGTQINFRFSGTTGLLPLYALNEAGYKRLIELSKDGKFKKIKNENSGGKKTSSKRKATESDTGIENEAKRSRGQTTGRVRAKVERYGMKQ